MAALKPNTIGVPAYRDDIREYLEIAVLHLTLRGGAKAARLIELAHRAMPYPVLLLAVAAPMVVTLSAAHKRWSQGEAGKTVLDGDVFVAIRSASPANDPLLSPFLQALSLNRQPAHFLCTRSIRAGLTRCWRFQAACKTGRFAMPTDSADQPPSRRDALAACARLEGRDSAARRRRQAGKADGATVALNLELKRVEAELATARNTYDEGHRNEEARRQ